MNRILTTLCICLFVLSAFGGQERDYIRRGNRYMRDSLYDKAQVEFQKALEVDNTCALAYYNLGNALLMQSKAEDAMKAYEQAAKLEKEPERLAHIHHNMGVLLQSAKQIQQALQCYKQALRNNPHADDTRYNYLLCLHQLKNQQGQDNQDQQKDENGEDEQKQQDKEQQDKQDQKNDEKKEEKEQDKPKPDPQQMSKENAEQMLQAAMQNEKETQEKIQQAQQQPQRKQLRKQW